VKRSISGRTQGANAPTVTENRPLRSARMSEADTILCRTSPNSVVVQMTRPDGSTYLLRVKEENLGALMAAAGMEFGSVVKAPGVVP
jgi:hypothetical protein